VCHAEFRSENYGPMSAEPESWRRMDREVFAALRFDAKNSTRIAPHSGASTPPVTSARWLSCGC